MKSYSELIVEQIRMFGDQNETKTIEDQSTIQLIVWGSKWWDFDQKIIHTYITNHIYIYWYIVLNLPS